MFTPKLSVCIATYNGSKYLKEQLDSILKQLGPGDEIIISDDTSSDGTVEILKDYAKKDYRIRLHLNQKFRDPIKNFQNALSNANGDFIYLSDQDDVWLDNKINTINELLKEYDLVLHNSIMTDENLNVIHPSFFDFFGSKKGLIKNILKSSYYGSCMAFQKWILDKSIPFPDTREIGHDLWIGLVAEMKGKVKFINIPFLLYRRHRDTFTPRGLGGSRRSALQIIFGRFVMLREVLNFWWREFKGKKFDKVRAKK